jgi:polysaccharide pyruvyl transferase WcaK-like protein
MKTKFKRIWHIGAWNRNIGDWTAGYNLHRMLEQQALKRDLAVTFYLVDSQRSTFHDALIEQINDEADLMLLGAGGMIFNRPRDQSASGWAFNIPAEKLKEIKAPIVVYGIGYNKFYFDKNKWPDYMGQHLRALQKQAKLFSVRNEGSRQMLHKVFGLDLDKIEIIPDPGMRHFDRRIDIPGLAEDRPIIGINWAGDRPHERFSEPWKKTRAYFVDTLRQALIKAVKQENAQILYIPHLQDVDIDIFDELKTGFPKGSILNLYEQLPHLYPPAGEIMYHHVPFMTNVYRQVDLMLGMRGHACIFAFGAGTKFIPIGSHNKVVYFAKDVGVPDYSIRMIDPNIETVDYIYDQITRCLHDKEYDKILPKLIDEQFSKLYNANERILDYLED